MDLHVQRDVDINRGEYLHIYLHFGASLAEHVLIKSYKGVEIQVRIYFVVYLQFDMRNDMHKQTDDTSSCDISND